MLSQSGPVAWVKVFCIVGERCRTVENGDGGGGGALGEIRTPDPRIRSPMLYPAELRARAGSITRLDRVGPAASDQSTPGSKRASSASRWPNELATNLSEEFLSSRGIGDGPVQYSLPNPERKNWSMDHHNTRRLQERRRAHSCECSRSHRVARRRAGADALAPGSGWRLVPTEWPR